MTDLNKLPDTAEDIVAALQDAGWTGDLRAQQTIALAEEVGEAVGAIRRYIGMARRTGGKRDAALELADVVITAFVTANVLDIDLPFAIGEKLQIIFSRPWRDVPSGQSIVDNPVTGKPLGYVRGDHG